MSRRTFRIGVRAPRPTSAWALVTVASATLWITQQLDSWAVALQGLAILLSLWRRERPFAWQRSGVALNAGMVAIVGATIAVALRGQPSTIALAHFAALTQGLQLLDARPRHTEFLLVTMALFQVILASNLTDSVFFPPLLVAFVFATVWTLLVHTLRSEALEAGDPRGVSRAITPGLLRMTLLASGLSVLLALALFVTLPRLRSSVIQGSGVGAKLATAGFSERVALGELGAIRMDPTVVMRIETLEGWGPPPGAGYWRGLAFDHFDGRSWSITPGGHHLVPGSAEGGVTLGFESDPVNLVQRVVREPVEAGVLFGAGEARHIHGSVRRLERDSSGGLYAVGQSDERLRYTVSSERTRHDEDTLRRDVAVPERRHPKRALQLPELSPAVAELAQRIVAGRESDAERARAIEQHLLRHGRYTNVPPRIDPEDPRSPVESFLFAGMAGHCEYFATSMVLLARSVGLPARLVNGFAGGHENSIGGFLEISRADAHTWVEIHYARAGWVRYDPTPADLRAAPAVALSASERLRELASAIELWWFQRVVGFDRSDQIRALKRAWLAWRGGREQGAPTRAPAPRAHPALDWERGIWLLLPLLGAAAATGLWRARRGGRAAAAPIPASYRQALRLLARRGLRREPVTTAREFARQVAAARPGTVGTAFQTITESYLAQRFGGAREAPAQAELRALRAGLRRSGST